MALGAAAVTVGLMVAWAYLGWWMRGVDTRVALLRRDYEETLADYTAHVRRVDRLTARVAESADGLRVDQEKLVEEVRVRADELDDLMGEVSDVLAEIS